MNCFGYWLVRLPLLFRRFNGRPGNGGPLLGSLVLAFILTGGAAVGAEPLPILVLESTGARSLNVIEGPAAQLDQPFSAASTFKIWLAALALEKGILTSTTRYPCQEPHLYGGRKAQIGLREALILSSNAFFRETARKLGLKAINQGLSRLGLTRPGLSQPDLSGPGSKRSKTAGKPLVRSVANAIHGDQFRITPREQHLAMRALADGALPVSADTRTRLRDALEWPVPDDAHWRVFGKTGCYGGAVWFTGFGEQRASPPPNGAIFSQPRPERKVVTVFVPGDLSRRPEVMRRFFKRFGLDWQEEWLADLGSAWTPLTASAGIPLPESALNSDSQASPARTLR